MNTMIREADIGSSHAVARAPAALPLYLREVRAELTRMRRMPEFAIPTLALPVMFYSLFGVALARPGSGGAGYLLATYGVFAALGPSLFGFGAGVAQEREHGVLALKQISPLPSSAYLAAKLANAFTFTTLVLLMLYAIAGFAGGVALPRSAWLTLFAIHVGSVVPFALLGLGIGLSLRAGGAMALTNLLFLSLAVFGGLWMPVSMFPSWMQQIGAFLPSSHLAALALDAAGRPVPGSVGMHVLAVIGFTAVFGAVAARAWRRATK
jgi:ABC-2 type transport system permease protein